MLPKRKSDLPEREKLNEFPPIHNQSTEQPTCAYCKAKYPQLFQVQIPGGKPMTTESRSKTKGSGTATESEAAPLEETLGEEKRREKGGREEGCSKGEKSGHHLEVAEMVD
ncbi:MAG: hypothetical protein M1834_002520 [Cirrosporium novae-zelandiae]|nr:MAG: hypothetical protein M1834_002520 [Cirrosporium novae-zelandiae]